MTRTEKIEALSQKHGNYCLCNDSAAICYCDKAAILDLVKECILAGIALRDAELLAMEFDPAISRLDREHHPRLKNISGHSTFVDGEIHCDERGAWRAGWIDGARWQHEQFIEAIKGDG